MKKYIISAALAALIFTGCSQKSVEVENPQPQQSEQTTQVNEGAGIQPVNQEQSSEELKLQKMKEIEAKAQKIYFDFDKYNIRPDQQPRVEYDANLFNQDDAKEFKIKVEGNCDEWGTDEYNYALGLKRAKSVKEALAARGVAADRMTIISYGESNPVCTEHTKECWAKNRRVEFELIP
ncbi:peptidoglycan-associated lipoprotein Pal [Nitratiruptor sp. YY09-18]|uniref:peptidoglycan-associated lipoprotein Pal n=1 Tax=Nitratiruptor sp. YY09-18 TaxID=2724901 RepID=UPI001915C624|nr:peptidoglycan-associated lipoprotein Pal [Nitratiruptor sp. YY09-18]BCD67788.1 peptidoglycan-associated lipoprotein [Nitratiruptor sp. YY09-18]